MATELIDVMATESFATEIASPADMSRIRIAAREVASKAGFSVTDCEEIVLVVSELVSNLIQHANGGMIRIEPVEAHGRTGIRIETEDHGPGIVDVEQALTDGYSTAGSLGIGLGTVNRLMDELEFYEQPKSGLRIVCHRWLRPLTGGPGAKGMIFGVATRACRFGLDNGDAFIVKQWEGHALAGVIDGLGHGVFAQRASHAARRYLEQHFDQSLESLFRGVERACKATRGVVMALARFDLPNQKLTVANVGNVEVRLIGSAEKFSPVVRRGVLGMNAPRPVCSEHRWTRSDLLIMHSDGLQGHWKWTDFSELHHQEPAVIASRLLAALGKIEDDATLIVARSANS